MAPKAGYGTPTVYVYKTDDSKADNNKIELVGNNYTISGITENKTIEIVSGKAEIYDVIFTAGTGYSIDCEKATNGVANVGYNTALNFSVALDPGYNMQRVTINGSVLNETSHDDKKYDYTINGITGNSTIEVTVKKEVYDVTYSPETNDAYELIKGIEKAEYGDTCRFYVIPNTGYNAPTVKVNDNILKPVNGTQYETTIIGPTNIVITAPTEKIQCMIIYNDAEGCDFETAPTAVPYGEELTFTLKIEKHYSNSKPVVSVGGKNQPAPTPSVGSDGEKTYQYTVPGITSEQIVTVSGIKKNTYKVILTSGEGYTITTTENTDVTAENDFRFKVTPNLGYSAISVDSIHSSNGQTVEEANDGSGDYIIKKLNSDTNITVDTLSKKQYKAIITGDEHATVRAVPEYDLNDIKHGDTLKFTVNSKNYYHVTRVFVNGDEKPAYNNVYTVSNVTDNIDIAVETKANTLTVTYVDEKYNTKIDDEVYTIEDDTEKIKDKETGKVKLHEIDDTKKLYDFIGWDNDNVAIDKNNDTKVTVTARWKIKESLASNVDISLTTEGKIDDSGFNDNGKPYTYKLSFKSIFKLAENLNEDIENIKITGYGTLYSDKEISIAPTYFDKIKNRVNKDLKPTLSKDTVTDNIFNYYANVANLSVFDLNDTNNFFSLNLGTNIQNAERYAVGWIELTIGTDTIIIYGKNACSIKKQD